MRRYGRKNIFSTVNMIPYIDVMLVLLIIFMVATPLINMGLLVDLPKASSDKIHLDEKPVILTISIDKRQFLQKGDGGKSSALIHENDVKAWLEKEKITKDTIVYVQADRNLVWQEVLFAMVRLNKLGWSKLTLVTQQEES
ncbi:MAG: biopolymer transporter ExbD [Pseudomonadota bacterium]|nr:biopolymer transporter ExbD [Pseudomonadota bacterium]